MQRSLFNYFKKTDTYSLPEKWNSESLKQPPAKKRRVGRPRKNDGTVSSPLPSTLTAENLNNSSDLTAPSSSSTSVIEAPVSQSNDEMIQHDSSSSNSVTDTVVCSSTCTTVQTDDVVVNGSVTTPLASHPLSPLQSLTPTTPTTPRTPTTAAVESKRGRYKSYSVNDRKKIVEDARLYGIRRTAELYKISASTVSSWMKINFDDVQPSDRRGARAPGGGQKTLIGSDNDEAILQWILQQRDLHIPVSRQAIQEQARLILGDSFGDFKASAGWLNRFLIRHNLSLRSRTSLSQKLPADLETKIQSFTQYVRKLREDDEYEDDFIINMDETPVFFDLVPNKTVEKKGSKSVIVRTSNSDKRHVTIVLAVTASGKILPTMIIFKGKRKLKDIKVCRLTLYFNVLF